MTTSIYHSDRLAKGYAFSRPPVHPEIIRRLQAQLTLTGKVRRALDIGCGAGLSTAALAPLADEVWGLDSSATMLTHCRAVAPTARFLVGQAEHLPFAAAAFQIETAAGSINYADPEVFLPEVARTLTGDGIFVIYDFSAARRMRGEPGLGEWFRRFECQYPPLPDYDLDVRTLRYADAGLMLATFDAFEVVLPMTCESYSRYVMSESGVEAALGRSIPEDEISSWCEPALAGLFAGTSREIVFDAYIATVTRRDTAGSR